MAAPVTMTPWVFDPLDDGEAVTSLNTVFANANTYLNDIGPESARLGAFNRFHAGRMVVEAGTVRAFTNTTVSSPETHTYDHDTFSTSLVYDSTGPSYTSSAGTDATGNNPTGDRILVGHEDTSASTEALLGLSARVGMGNAASAADKLSAILVLANIEVVSAVEDVLVDAQVMFVIQFELNNTTWYNLFSSYRFVSIPDHDPESTGLSFDVPIYDVITAPVIDDVGDSSTDTVTGIRLMTSLARQSGTPASAQGYVLGAWNLSAVGLFTSDPE